jgi:hypothetical protein
MSSLEWICCLIPCGSSAAMGAGAALPQAAIGRLIRDRFTIIVSEFSELQDSHHCEAAVFGK